MMYPFPRATVWVLSFAAALLLTDVGLLAEKQRKPPRTTAHSVVSPSYQRERLPNGRWKPETYVFGEGTLIDRSGGDDSLIALTFREMGAILAEALLREDYVPTPSEAETDLLILVSWGKTMPHDDGIREIGLDGMAQAMGAAGRINGAVAARSAASGQAASMTAGERSEMSSLESEMTSMMMLQGMSDRARMRSNDYNARLLGYAPALYESYSSNPIGMQRSILDSLIEEIESPRYFVILQAFDFQKMWKEKETELLWITRFNIRAKGKRFNEELADMSLAASSLFGSSSRTLKRHLLPGTVVPGELEVISVEEE